MAVVYALTLLAWIYFRSGSVGLAGGDSFATANTVLGGIFSGVGFSLGAVINKFQVIKGVLLIGILLAVEISNVRFKWNVRQVEQPVLRLVFFAGDSPFVPMCFLTIWLHQALSRVSAAWCSFMVFSAIGVSGTRGSNAFRAVAMHLLRSVWSLFLAPLMTTPRKSKLR